MMESFIKDERVDGMAIYVLCCIEISSLHVQIFVHVSDIFVNTKFYVSSFISQVVFSWEVDILTPISYDF